MSRVFTKNTSNFMELPSGYSNAFDGATSIAASIFFNITSATNNSTSNYLFNLPCQGSASQAAGCNLNGAGGSIVVKATGRPQSSDTISHFSHSVDLTTGEWHHAGVLFDWAGDRFRIVVDGANGEEGALSFTNTTFNGGASAPARIGSWSGALSTSMAFDGKIAHLAWWRDVDDWADAEFANLFFGADPFNIRPGNLVGYLPLWGQHSPEIELVAGQLATITGSVPAGADDPWVRTGRLWVPVSFVPASQPAAIGDGDLALPSPTVAGTGATGIQGDLNRALPAITVSGTAKHGIAGSGDLALPAPTADGSGVKGFAGSGALTLPQLVPAGDGDFGFPTEGHVTLPPFTAAGTGRFAWIGNGAATAPSPTVTGNAKRGVSGNGDATLPALECQGVLFNGFLAFCDLTLPAFTVEGEAFLGIKGDGDLTLPAIVCRGVKSVPGAGGVGQRRRGGFGIGFG